MSAKKDQSMGQLVTLVGGPRDTGNLGVSALGESTIHAIRQLRPDARILVLDNGKNRRKVADPILGAYSSDGAWISRRLHRDESLWAMRANSLTRLPPNRNVDSIRESVALLDMTGGDSFTDLYGRRRWQLSVLPKLIALRVATPLVLLPQTYGPFTADRRRRRAALIVADASQAWARDPDGLDRLRELLGSRFDPVRHRQGVDVAFALPMRQPSVIPQPLASWLADDSDEVVVGLNVSGLLMNDPATGSSQFGLTIDYPHSMLNLARRLLDEVADRLVLVPHVVGPGPESDVAACERLAAQLDRPNVVAVLPGGLDAGTTKWYVSRFDWFCGTRMHSTIAAMSSGVPTAAVAYSHKTRGVFATCGLAHRVADARSATSEGALVDELVDGATGRDNDRMILTHTLPEVVARAKGQFVEIVDAHLATNGTT